jgi:hypothetical protein
MSDGISRQMDMAPPPDTPTPAIGTFRSGFVAACAAEFAIPMSSAYDSSKKPCSRPIRASRSPRVDSAVAVSTGELSGSAISSRIVAVGRQPKRSKDFHGALTAELSESKWKWMAFARARESHVRPRTRARS